MFGCVWKITFLIDFWENKTIYILKIVNYIYNITFYNIVFYNIYSGKKQGPLAGRSTVKSLHIWLSFIIFVAYSYKHLLLAG